MWKSFQATQKSRFCLHSANRALLSTLALSRKYRNKYEVGDTSCTFSGNLHRFLTIQTVITARQQNFQRFISFPNFLALSDIDQQFKVVSPNIYIRQIIFFALLFETKFLYDETVPKRRIYQSQSERYRQ